MQLIPRYLGCLPTAAQVSQSAGAVRDCGPDHSGPLRTGTVVSATRLARHLERATPAALVVIVPATEFVPSPLPFQTARLKVVNGGKPPTLYYDDSPFGSTRVLPYRIHPQDRELAVGP